ncbi:MAG: FAD-dependent oxidoreductase [Acidobacteriaceae bacterium]
MANKRVVIVGGVAGGATCAARLRRLDEQAEILLLDRGPYVSFANCGLPYYVGNVIHDEAKLLVATPALFKDRFNIEVRTRHEVTEINREAQTVEIHDQITGRKYTEHYDNLVLSPGAAPIRPRLPGIHLPGIFTLRSIPDSREIREWIDSTHPESAVVVGGGFIGLEMAENLAHRGIKVTIVEMAKQLMPPLDPEMAEYARVHMIAHKVQLAMGDAVASFEQSDKGSLVVRTQSGASYGGDLVILALGVRPETKLARDAGLEIGERGGIRVDTAMRTSDPKIWAIGDAVETRNLVTGQWELIPLAGPANRQARIAAGAICGRDVKFDGVLGTAVCGFFGMTVALTGATERSLSRAGMTDYQAIYLHPNQHVAYYPGAHPIHMKLLFRKSDGLVLGAQAVGGSSGAERRIDVIATAIQMKATVFDLEDIDLCYAPQYGAARDPANMAGMIAANILRNDVRLAPWDEVPSTSAVLLDVREPHEYAVDPIAGAYNVPLGQLRSRLHELPKSKEIWVNCAVGQRGYFATRILTQHGFQVRNLSGGVQTYAAFYPES